MCFGLRTIPRVGAQPDITSAAITPTAISKNFFIRPKFQRFYIIFLYLCAIQDLSSKPPNPDTLILLFQFLLSHHKFIQIFKIIQIFIKNFTALAKKIRTADNIDNSYFILSIFVRTPNAEISHQKVLFVREIQGLRSLKKRSILHVCEHFEGKHNAEVSH